MGHRITLQQAFDPRHNSLDFLRFLLAAFVILSHCYPLGGLGEEPLARVTGGQESFGGLAVAGFFALSGFLITRSYISGNAVLPFLWNRCLRIFPAFWVCLILTALVWVPALYWIRHGELLGFWSDHGHEAWRYVRINAPLKIRQWGVAPVFDTLPYPGVLNGSLWSLHYEFQCYLLVALAGLLRLLRRRAFVLSAFVGLFAFDLAEQLLPGSAALVMGSHWDALTVRLLLWFLAGSVSFLYGDCIPLSGRLGLACLVLTILATRWGLLDTVLPMTGTYLLLWGGVNLPLQSFGRQGDYSYGLYIYAFPIQQTLALWGAHGLGVTLYFGLSLLCTLPLAVLSYHVIERPALRWKSRPVRAAEGMQKRVWTGPHWFHVRKLFGGPDVREAAETTR